MAESPRVGSSLRLSFWPVSALPAGSSRSEFSQLPHMKTPPRRVVYPLFGLMLVCAGPLGAQTRTPAPPASNARDETVTLNPFEVKADSDTSYGALNANSITAFNLPIDRLPVT